MTFQMILGKAGSGKTTYLVAEIAAKMKKEQHKNIILIVPDQMTFQMETYFLKKTGSAGMMNLQVYSFNRLAFRVLQETGGLSNTFLTTTGMEMLVRDAIRENESQLKIFKRAANKKGFYKELVQLFKEMKQYEIDKETMTQETTDHATNQKMQDVALLYEKYQEKLFGKYMEKEDYLRLLKEQMENSSFMKDTLIYIDGFDHFSAQERSVIGEMMRLTDKVTISMTLRENRSNTQNLDLFQMVQETYEQLRTLAAEYHVIEEPPVLLSDNKRARRPALSFLEENWGNAFSRRYEGETDGLHLHQASNRRAELEGIARNIKRLVQEEGYRFQDMSILVRNLKDYTTIIEAVLLDMDIPYFLDHKRSMGSHPFIEFIKSSLETIRKNWAYETIFQTVRTEFLFPLQEDSQHFRQKVDQFENYLLENGIYNKQRWFQSETWRYRKIRGLMTDIGVQTDEEKEMEQLINDLRSSIQTPLLFLEQQLKGANTGRDYAAAFYQYLQRIEAPERLELWRQKAEERGMLELAREHEQAWRQFCSLLDEFVEILGESTLSQNDFTEIILTGLDALEFSLLPPALDQVIIGDMEKARLLDAKIVFAIGLNEGVFPKRLADGGVLSEQDRQALAQNGIELKPSNQKQLVYEEFIAYRLFSLPSDHLYLSYPAADEEGKLLPESSYLRKLKTQFPQLTETIDVLDPTLLQPTEQLAYIVSGKNVLSYLTTQLQQYKRGYSMDDVWWETYNYYARTKNKDAMQILQSLSYENQTHRLQETTAKELFGEKIHASVSRMEGFFSCEFQHFAQYGLKLEERATYSLEAVDMGDIFHGAMEWIAIELKRRGLDWGALDSAICEDLAQKAMDYLAPKLQHEILLSSHRMAYIQYKLLRIITRATKVLNEQAKYSAFRPLDLEVAFGINGQIPPMRVPLKHQQELILQGRIDRIDVAEQNDRMFLRIIDYKSSTHDLPLTEVYYGIALQMLTYLDIVVTNADKLIGRTAEPAGVLYFHLHNQLIHADHPLTEQEIEKELQKSYRMKGLILSDPLAVSLMDNSLDDGGSSLIVPAEIKKDGTLGMRSKTATKKEFEQMRHYVRKKYQEAGNRIVTGQVSINPYKLREQTPCTFCPFRSVCQFDPASGHDHYRFLANAQAKEVLKKIAEGEEDDEANS
ncbi:helicase-exonuclease AddAB subunit AddB [Listeria costaricensis]|uniref:helicase-exonuclease AddAB subunit AddB n=1 Tax=Listeria costaricensis TaxID=2026604 RepID=UPI000C07BEC1|nr:helicase-exonuclease AddAB subunit AddB [Listeria costaricensis]